MRKILKFLCILIMAGIIFGLVYIWTPVWIPKNNILLSYNNKTSEFAITKYLNKQSIHIREFDIERLIPGRLQSITLPMNIQIIEAQIKSYLPNAKTYSQLLNISEDQFSAQLSIRLLYRLNMDTLKEYISTNYVQKIPHSSFDVLLMLKEQLNTAIHKKVTMIIATHQNTSSSSPLSSENWNQVIVKDLKSSLSKFELPIMIEEIFITPLSIPNLNLYNDISQSDSNNLSQNQSGNLDSKFSNNTQWMNQYIYLIKSLSNITRVSPEAIEIIKILPPTMLYNPNVINNSTE